MLPAGTGHVVIYMKVTPLGLYLSLLCCADVDWTLALKLLYLPLVVLLVVSYYL
jgi:hypothetical protein